MVFISNAHIQGLLVDFGLPYIHDVRVMVLKRVAALISERKVVTRRLANRIDVGDRPGSILGLSRGVKLFQEELLDFLYFSLRGLLQVLLHFKHF